MLLSPPKAVPLLETLITQLLQILEQALPLDALRKLTTEALPALMRSGTSSLKDFAKYAWSSIRQISDENSLNAAFRYACASVNANAFTLLRKVFSRAGFFAFDATFGVESKLSSAKWVVFLLTVVALPILKSWMRNYHADIPKEISLEELVDRLRILSAQTEIGNLSDQSSSFLVRYATSSENDDLNATSALPSSLVNGSDLSGDDIDESDAVYTNTTAKATPSMLTEPATSSKEVSSLSYNTEDDDAHSGNDSATLTIEPENGDSAEYDKRVQELAHVVREMDESEYFNVERDDFDSMETESDMASQAGAFIPSGDEDDHLGTANLKTPAGNRQEKRKFNSTEKDSIRNAIFQAGTAVASSSKGVGSFGSVATRSDIVDLTSDTDSSASQVSNRSQPNRRAKQKPRKPAWWSTPEAKAALSLKLPAWSSNKPAKRKLPFQNDPSTSGHAKKPKSS